MWYVCDMWFVLKCMWCVCVIKLYVCDIYENWCYLFVYFIRYMYFDGCFGNEDFNMLFL